MTPYEASYGTKPLSVASYLRGSSNIHAMDSTLHTKSTILYTVKDNLSMSQNRMKQQVD